MIFIDHTAGINTEARDCYQQRPLRTAAIAGWHRKIIDLGALSFHQTFNIKLLSMDNIRIPLVPHLKGNTLTRNSSSHSQTNGPRRQQKFQLSQATKSLTRAVYSRTGYVSECE